MQRAPDVGGERVAGAVDALHVVQQPDQRVVGGGAVAEGEQEVADAAADVVGEVGVAGDVLVLVVRQQRAVLGEGGGRFAELFQALGGVVAGAQGLRVGLPGLGGAFVGEAAQFGQGAPVLAVVHEGRRVLLAQGAHDRGAFAVLFGGGGQDGAEDVDGLGDAALAEEAVDVVDGAGDVGLPGVGGGRGRGRLRGGGAGAVGPGGVRAHEGAGGVEGAAGGHAARGQQQRQVLVDLLGGGGAVLRVLGEQAQDQRFERLGDLRADAAHGQRGLVQVPVEHAERGGTGERDVAAEQFVQQDAERVQVGVRADGAAHGLLGCHVGGRADGGAGVGEAGGVGVHDGGDAEVEDGDRAVLPDHHVARFEVAVDDRHRVHGAEDGAQLGADRDGPLPRVGLVLGEVVGEVGAVDVLHDEEEVLVLAARVVHRDQAGVVDLGGDPALAHEAAAQFVGLRARHLVGAQQFHRHAPVQAPVVGRPDLAHAALADERGQLVPAGDDASCRHGHLPPSGRPSRPSCRRR